MDTFKVIRDKDLGLDTPEPSTWGERKTGRAIIFDDAKNVALLHVTKKHYHKLPGGGVEEGENEECGACDNGGQACISPGTGN